MDWLDAEVVFPMHFKDRLKGFLVLGEKRSGRVYSRGDIDLLVPLCHQSAVAIQNAHAYQALRDFNTALEAKVAERTQALEVALEEKERTQEQLIRSESLAALGQLVAGVAHEMNNPLASVTSLLQSVSEELAEWDTGQPLDEELLDDLRFADKELARAKSIVASLLGLSRQTQTYEESVDMNLVVRDTLRVLHNHYKYKTLSIEEDLNPHLPMIQGNFANLGQVALNIVRNAIQAVADHTGAVSLATSYDTYREQVVFRCCDNGPGIPSDARQDVFKPFYTTKPVGEGTGLGLYVCHQIVHRHKGVIELAAADPGGTAVTVRLPAAPAGGLTSSGC
jgi:two-component system NtrC family sensor kinase